MATQKSTPMQQRHSTCTVLHWELCHRGPQQRRCKTKNDSEWTYSLETPALWWCFTEMGRIALPQWDWVPKPSQQALLSCCWQCNGP